MCGKNIWKMISPDSQQIAGMLAALFSFLALLFTVIWMKGTNLDESYLGGLNWGDLIFNWHPILMVAGLLTCSANALVTYRLLPFGHSMNKLIHVMWHTAGVICFSTGLSAVFIGNNFKNKNTSGVYYSNLNSLHSFLGLSAICLYGQNYILGFLFFLFPSMRIEWKKSYLPNHVFLGTFAFFAAVFAVETGVMELSTELQCGYEISVNATSADWNPAENYHLLKEGCKLANGVGIFALLTALFTAFTLIRFKSKHHKMDGDDDDNKILLNQIH